MSDTRDRKGISVVHIYVPKTLDPYSKSNSEGQGEIDANIQISEKYLLKYNCLI